MNHARIIPFLLIKDGRLVKTHKFGDPKYIGDPINAVKIFNEKEVDELVLFDISSSGAAREPDIATISEIASEAFMPVGYGGGVRSMNHVEALFAAGVEKVSLNSALFDNPALVAEATRTFGNQSIVAGIDVRKGLLGGNSVISHGGKRKQPVDPVDHARRIEDLGIGEIVVQSIDRDGTMAGYDLALIEKIAKSVAVPVVAIGGAGTADHLREGLRAGASAAGAGSMFVYQGTHRAVLISYVDPFEINA